MRVLILGLIFTLWAGACSEKSFADDEFFFGDSENGSFVLMQKTEIGDKEFLRTDSLNAHFDIYPLLDEGRPALFFYEMWEDGNVLSIYNIEQDRWILRNFGPVQTEIELDKSDSDEFVAFLTDENIVESVPYFSLPVPMKIIDDKELLERTDCDSESFAANVSRSEKFLNDNKGRLSSLTKSIISGHLKKLEQQCEQMNKARQDLQ